MSDSALLHEIARTQCSFACDTKGRPTKLCQTMCSKFQQLIADHKL